MRPIRIAIIGFGKIARDQHVAAIANTPGMDLIATADPHSAAPGLPSYSDIAALIAGEPDLDAVSLCQPPQLRHAAARAAIMAGKHVLLEKPPGVGTAQVEELVALAAAHSVTLFTAWHSQEAAAVAPARAWLARTKIRHIRIVWKEDVRVWHPGQTWIWQEGGMGVFDTGINALSILTDLVCKPLHVAAADLDIPSNCAAPIAARLTLTSASGMTINADLDFLQTGPQSWDIFIETEAGELILAGGGNRLIIAGAPQPVPVEAEYPALYQRFADRIGAGTSEVDLAPLRLVEEALRIGTQREVAAFYD